MVRLDSKAYARLIAATLCASSLASAKRFTKAADAVRLEEIQALTLQDGKMTTGRRVAAMPQLNCVGGSGCNHYKAESVRCVNSGSSYSTDDVEWTCTASLPAEFKLGSTNVVCEGYDSPEDPFVLKGSCGLEYRLLLTDVGQEKLGSSRGSGRFSDEDTGGLPTWLFWLLFLAVLFFIGQGFYRTFFGGDGGGNGGWGGGGGGGGGWGGDDNDDPPPPYAPRAPPYIKTQSPRARNPGWGFGWPGMGRQTRQGQGQGQRQGWRPGFWTGAATGAAAGYMAGGRGNNSARAERRPVYDPGEGSSFGPSGGYGRRTSSPYRPSSSLFGSSTYTSTGFGGTSRR